VALEQVAQEVLGAHGLDLAAEPVERVAVDAGEQAPVADFLVRGVCGASRREASTQDQTVALEPRHRDVDLPRLEAQPVGERRGREGPAHLGVPAYQGQHRVVARRGRGIDVRRYGAPRGADVDGLDHARVLEREGELPEAGRAPGPREIVEQRSPGLLDGRRHQAHERVVQLVGVARLRARLFHDARDGRLVERAEIALVLRQRPA
jgi:hypothetical protein